MALDLLPFTQEVTDTKTTAADIDNDGQFTAAFQREAMNAPIGITGEGVLSRSLTLKEARERGDEALAPEELNNIFAGSNIPDFDKPMSLFSAQLIAEHEQRKLELEQKLNEGPNSGIVNFAAAATAHLTDPLEFGATALTGIGVAKALPALSATARTGVAAQRAGAGAKIGLVEGVISEGIIQGGTLALTDEDVNDFDMYDALSNAAIGIGLSAGITSGLTTAIGRAEPTLRDGPTAHRNKHNGAVARTLEDKKVRSEETTKEAISSIHARDVPSLDVRGGSGKVYALSNLAEGVEGPIKTIPIQENMGKGLVYASNSEMLVKRAANSMERETAGSVIEVDLQDLKLLDLDQEVKSIPELEVALNNQRIQTPEGKTIREVYEEVRQAVMSKEKDPEALDALNDVVKGLGNDGIVYNGRKYAGQDMGEHQVVMLYETDKSGKLRSRPKPLTEDERALIKKDHETSVGRLKSNAIKSANTTDDDAFFQPAVAKEAEENSVDMAARKANENADVDKRLEESKARVANDLAEAPAEAKALAEEAVAIEKKANVISDVYNNLKQCMVRHD